MFATTQGQTKNSGLNLNGVSVQSKSPTNGQTKKTTASLQINGDSLQSIQEFVRSKSASSNSIPSKRSLSRLNSNRSQVKTINIQNKSEKKTQSPTISITKSPSKKANGVNNSEKYHSIVEECRKSKKKFTDSDFPPNATSIYINPQNPNPEWPNSIQWKRITEFCSNAQLFTNGIEAGDVIQGVLGDCWFLGALSVTATRPDLVLKSIPETELNEWGVYEFFFFKNGDWKSVIIDDFIPLNNGKPIFSSCLDPNEVWVLLIEKAYAKLHKSYQHLEGGSESYALVDLTGGVPETIELDSRETSIELTNNKLWEKMKKYISFEFLMGCAKLVTNGVAEENTGNGILQNHAYGILELQELKGAQLLRIRNPWGQGEWKGKWSDGAKEWDAQTQKALKHNFVDDGTFWMEFSDFVKEYNRLYLLRFFDSNWSCMFVKGEWKGEAAGGCGNFSTWKNNPQYGFQISQPEEVFITLIQDDVRLNGKLESNINIGFVLLKTTDLNKKLKHLKGSDIVGQTTFSTSREVSKKFKLESGCFVILPTTFYPNQCTSFYIRAYKSGNTPFDFVELGQKKLESIPYILETPTNARASKTQNNLKSSEKSENLRLSKEDMLSLSEDALSKMQKDLEEVLNIRSPPKTPQSSDAPRYNSNLDGSIFNSVFSLKETNIVNSILQRLATGVGVLSSQEYSLSLSHLVQFSPEEPEIKSSTLELLKQYHTQAQISLRNGDVREEAYCYYKSATLCDKELLFSTAVDNYNKFLTVVKEAGDIVAEALALNHLGVNFIKLGRLRNAIECHSKHHSISKDKGSRFLAISNLGIAFSCIREYPNAFGAFLQGLNYARKIGDSLVLGLALELLAFIALKSKEYTKAQEYLEERLFIAESDVNKAAIVNTRREIEHLMPLCKSEYEEKAKSHFRNTPNLSQDYDAQLTQEIANSEGGDFENWYEKGNIIFEESEFGEISLSEPSTPPLIRKSSLEPKINSNRNSIESILVSVRTEDMEYKEDSEGEEGYNSPPSPTSSVYSLLLSNFNSKLEGKDSRDKTPKTPTIKKDKNETNLLDEELKINERIKRYK